MVLFAIQTCKSYSSRRKGGQKDDEDDTLIIISFPHPQLMMPGEANNVANDDDYDSDDSAVDGGLESYDGFDSDDMDSDDGFRYEDEDFDDEDYETDDGWEEGEPSSKSLALTSLAQVLETIRRRHSKSTRKLVLDVTLSMGWNAMLETEWNWFVGTLGSCLVNLESLETRQQTHYSTEFLSDKRLQSLLRHLAPRLRHLHIGNTQDYPRTFETLRSLQALQDLTIAKTSDAERKRVTWRSWEKLGQSLQVMPNLERVVFDSVQFVEVDWDPSPTKQVWDPIVSSLGKIRRLSRCRFENCRVTEKRQGQNSAQDGVPLTVWQESSYRKLSLSEDEQRTVTFFPRLNKDANLQYLLQQRESARVAECVDALIAVEDRVDCLQYLLKEVFDPATLAMAALNHQ